MVLWSGLLGFEELGGNKGGDYVLRLGLRACGWSDHNFVGGLGKEGAG